MTDTYEDIEARLRSCLGYAARAVPDEVPALFLRPARAGRPRGRRWDRSAGVVASAAVVMVLAALGLSVRTGAAPRSQLISAIETSIAAQTARVRLTSVPSVATEAGENAVAMTALGVVDFAVPSMAAAYPDGYGWVDIGERSWQTAWPPKTGAGKWEPSTSPAEPPGTSAGELELLNALKADTSPGALLAALRSGAPRVTRLGTQTVDGMRAAQFRASVGKLWRADVWVAKGRLLRVDVEGPSGSLSEEYYDYGVTVHIAAP